MADGADNSSKTGSSSKESKNKRKLVDPLPLNPVNPASLLTQFPPYKPSLEKSQNPQRNIGPLQVGPSQPKLIANESEPNDWTDPIAIQLEGLLLSNLHTIFESAINQIIECGYSRDIAEKAISRLGLYRGGKDLVSNVLDDALVLLKKGNDINSSRDIVFDNLQQMTEYTMLELINVLKEVKLSLSTGEAMWWLLLCDMNIAQACAVEGDLLSEFSCKEEVLGEGSSVTTPFTMKLEAHSSEVSLQNHTKVNTPKFSAQNTLSNLPEKLKFGSLPNLSIPKKDSLQDVGSEKESLVSVTSLGKTLGSNVQSFQATHQVSEEKLRHGHKAHKKKETAPWQKSLHTERPHKHYGKLTFKSGNIATIGGSVLEKRGKPLSELPTLPVKDSASKAKANTEILVDESHPVSSNSPSASAATNSAVSTSSEKKVPSKPETSISVYPDISTYLAGIPYDKSLGKYVPQDEKDELILKLVPQAQQLQSELQGWTDWANQKVMEATRRLGKDMAELKALRKEKEEAEKFKKDKKVLEENTMKRLSEMELALNNTTAQIERANSTIFKLKTEQLMLKREMEAAKRQAAESASHCQEALEREQKALRDAQSLEGTKGWLQEELKSLKEKEGELKQKLDKAKNGQNQIEVRWRQERMKKEKLLAQAASTRKEREQLEAAAKVEEDKIRLKAEDNLKKTVEDIKKLENEISELKLKSDASTRAALSKGFKGNYGTTDSDDAKLDIDGGKDYKNTAKFKEKSETGGLREERECVMCLSEEMSVVFLPCAHQVLCTECNELHEKQGMKECPSCRTSIQRRIPAHFAGR